MPTISVEAQVSAHELLKAAAQLDNQESEQFVQEAIALQARRKAPSLPRDEATLLQLVNQGVPARLQERYDGLIARRWAECLTSEEHEELLQLTDEIEQIDAQRAEHLAQLAHVRGVSLTQLVNDLGIAPSARA